MKEPAEDFYYIQDTRSVTGNSAVWWRHGAKGYTCDLNAAMIAPGTWSSVRDTDVLRPVDQIDAMAARHFDVQNLDKLKP